MLPVMDRDRRQEILEQLERQLLIMDLAKKVHDGALGVKPAIVFQGEQTKVCKLVFHRPDTPGKEEAIIMTDDIGDRVDDLQMMLELLHTIKKLLQWTSHLKKHIEDELLSVGFFRRHWYKKPLNTVYCGVDTIQGALKEKGKTLQFQTYGHAIHVQTAPDLRSCSLELKKVQKTLSDYAQQLSTVCTFAIALQDDSAAAEEGP